MTIAHPRQAGTIGQQEGNRLPAAFAPAPRAKLHLSNMEYNFSHLYKAAMQHQTAQERKLLQQESPKAVSCGSHGVFPLLPRQRERGFPSAASSQHGKGPGFTPGMTAPGVLTWFGRDGGAWKHSPHEVSPHLQKLLQCL